MITALAVYPRTDYGFNMSNATLSIRAHFDGRFIIPDEPVDLPVDAPLNIEVTAASPPAVHDQAEIGLKLAALGRFTKRGVAAACIPDEMLRRERIYGDDGR